MSERAPKYPQVMSAAEAIANLDQFDAIIDARSPSEYAEDHLPGAVNYPVLDDEERARVGTIYKQVNPFEAKKIGAALVSKNIGLHIEHHMQGYPREWRPLVYCWRGGSRSGAMAIILAKIGWPVVQLEGGYKAYRGEVNTALAERPPHQFRVVCGTTGSGKSRLLQTLARLGAQVLDLEQLAAHRGSVLGHLPDEPQPTQKLFETHVWDKLRTFDPARPVFVESESKKVGNLRVPDALMESMRQSPCIALELAREQRVQLLMEDYHHFVDNPAVLNTQLDCLVKLHGHERIKAWHDLANGGRMPELVDELLRDHYDPAYTRSIFRNFVKYNEADPLELTGIGEADFERAARRLMA
ncbi:tRNA 2-selenouridine(34) synthase MnmH [Massilia arenosa]|uniref:tRNA 2-selenouridine(34) synthase MnmH n=1 Tax=Zemynaea arenosa TaxID=2561931 RepID=A0A4Y9RUM3_9BURK|nr:tRNA 2-selenouridine(34) synthase MnmH [Massilia arenosa]TFW11496.1 tRNA 2-selenouridine(34) synthase MnmH [Massilia arenosa]